METPPPKRLKYSEKEKSNLIRKINQEYQNQLFHGQVPEDIFDQFFNQIWSETITYISECNKEIKFELEDSHNKKVAAKVRREIIKQITKNFIEILNDRTDLLIDSFKEFFKVGEDQIYKIDEIYLKQGLPDFEKLGELKMKKLELDIEQEILKAIQ